MYPVAAAADQAFCCWAVSPRWATYPRRATRCGSGPGADGRSGRLSRRVSRICRSCRRGGKLYVFGGIHQDTAGRPLTNLQDAWSYDIKSDAWTELPKLPVARRAWAAIELDRKIYLLGGYTDSFSADVYSFDLKSHELVPRASATRFGGREICTDWFPATDSGWRIRRQDSQQLDVRRQTVKTLELFQLRGKVALVSGGAGIVGRFLVRGLAEAGATVVMASRGLAACESVAAEMQAEELAVFAEQCDFTSEAEIRGLRQRLLDRYGRVDVLFNNAVARSGGELMDTSLTEWESVMALNSTGLFLSCRLFGRR